MARPVTARVRVVRLPHALDLPLPSYQTRGAAGVDLVAALPAGKPVIIARGKRALIPTGLVLELPAGLEAQVRPRSGLALRHGVTVLNSPGTVDSDYRGEVQVILVNLGEAPFKIERGDRIAQMVVQTVVRAQLVPAITARETERGSGGFGSTGVGTARAGKAARAATRGTKRQAKARSRRR